MAAEDIKRSGRATQGVIVMRLRDGERVSALAPVAEPEAEPETNGAEALEPVAELETDTNGAAAPEPEA
jgi:hypothetical protein